MRTLEPDPVTFAPPLWSRACIAWIGGLFIALVTAMAVYDVVSGYRSTVETTGRELDAQAHGIAEQTARSLQAVDLVLRHIGERYQGGALTNARRDDRQAWLAQQALDLAQVEGFVLIDRTGAVLAASTPDAATGATLPGPDGASLFDTLRTGAATGLSIGDPTQPAGAGAWLFPVARRINDDAGEFAGVAQALVRVAYFRRFYADLRLAADATIDLLRQGGTLLASHPDNGSTPGQRVAWLDTLWAQRAVADAPIQRVTNPQGGVARFAALAPVAGYPLAVVATRAVRAALAPWRHQAAGSVLRTLALGLLAAALLALLRRQFAYLHQTRESLEISRERFALAAAGSDVGIWDWDLAGDRVFASPRAREIFGLAPGPERQTRDEWFAAIRIHPDDAAARWQAIEDHLDGRSPAYFGEYRVQHPGGEYRWVRVHGLCVRHPTGGRAVRMAGSVSDIDSQKRAEASLRESEERHALAVAGSDDGVWDWNFASGVAFESQRARELQGLPLAPESQPLAELIASLRVHPDDAARRDAALRAHLAGESPSYECEYRVLHADGRCRWIRVRALCVRDHAGQPCRIAGSISDIDARKRAEQALRQSEERFALAVAGSNDGILDWDITSDSMYVSARALQIVGIDTEATVRTRADWTAMFFPLLHPDDASRLSAVIGGLHNDDRRVHDGEYRTRQADGEYRWVRFRGMHVRDAGDRPIRWAGSVSDIDAAKKVEEALRRSEQRYELAVAGSNEGLWDWDLPSDRLFLSQRAQELLWLEPSEPQRLRRYWIDNTYYHPDDVGMVRATISAHLRGDTRHFMVEYRLRHHSGQWHWYRQRGVAVRDAQGRPTRMAGSMEDITDRKNADAERLRLEAQLRQAQKLEAIGTLAGGIAHDFNNILAAILGYGEMAQKDAAAGSALRSHIDAAINAGMRAKSLVERILAFSRSGMGERVAVHAQSVVAEALDAVAASLPPAVHLERRLAAGGAAVFGDPTQVHQVVLNLCANAVQAMRSAGQLTVTLDRIEPAAPNCATGRLCRGSYLRLAVQDTGVGIAAHIRERIFDPFFTTKEIGVGTGLGLSLVHGIVTDLGGGIEVDSSVGAGSIFTVFLPLHEGVVPPVPRDEPAAPNGRGETILLVDDEEALVRLGEEMIAGLGYEPVGFISGHAALQAFEADPARFDAVLSDEAMPGITGSQLADRIHAIRPGTPVVLVSGYLTASLAARARAAGVVEVLAKPLASRDISRSLAAALRPSGASIPNDTLRAAADTDA